MKIVQYNENNVITRIQKPHDSFLDNSTTTHASGAGLLAEHLDYQVICEVPPIGIIHYMHRLICLWFHQAGETTEHSNRNQAKTLPQVQNAQTIQIIYFDIDASLNKHIFTVIN